MAQKLKNWIDIENSSAFKSMTPAQQKKARDAYPFYQYKVQEFLRDIEQNVYNSTRKILDTIHELTDAIQKLDKVGESNKVQVGGVTEALENGINELVKRVEAAEGKMQGISDDLKTATFLQGDNALQAIESIKKSLGSIEIPEPQTVSLKGTEDMLNRINRKIAAITKEPEKRPTKWVASVAERDLNDNIQSVTLTAVH